MAQLLPEDACLAAQENEAAAVLDQAVLGDGPFLSQRLEAALGRREGGSGAFVGVTLALETGTGLLQAGLDDLDLRRELVELALAAEGLGRRL